MLHEKSTFRAPRKASWTPAARLAVQTSRIDRVVSLREDLCRIISTVQKIKASAVSYKVWVCGQHPSRS